jgi:hypothetical protein
MKLSRNKRAHGQSIVEFAISSIILFLLLTAVVDVGLIFYTYQTMITAVNEGLSYGAYRPVLPNTSNPSSPSPNDQNIRYRIRYAGGDPATRQASVSFANLLDLNTNSVDDNTEASSVLNQYIAISAYQDGNPSANCSDRKRNCWLRVDLRYDYRLIFPLAPTFGDTFEIHVIRDQQIIRSSE